MSNLWILVTHFYGGEEVVHFSLKVLMLPSKETSFFFGCMKNLVRETFMGSLELKIILKISLPAGLL